MFLSLSLYITTQFIFGSFITSFPFMGHSSPMRLVQITNCPRHSIHSNSILTLLCPTMEACFCSNLTGSLYANSAIVFYLKSSLSVFNFTIHQVLELIKCPKLHNIFLRMSGSCPSHWIITSSHYVEKGTPAMGSLWRLSCNGE